MKILHLICSPRGHASQSAAFSRHLVEKLTGTSRGSEVAVRCLSSLTMPHVDREYSLASRSGSSADAEEGVPAAFERPDLRDRGKRRDRPRDADAQSFPSLCAESVDRPCRTTGHDLSLQWTKNDRSPARSSRLYCFVFVRKLMRRRRPGLPSTLRPGNVRSDGHF